MNSFYSDNSYLNITYNGYYKTINRTIHNYGISNMGVFEKSDVHFSGTAPVEYYSTNDLYGLGDKIDQPKSGVSGPGLTYDQAALLDQYVSTMTGGKY